MLIDNIKEYAEKIFKKNLEKLEEYQDELDIIVTKHNQQGKKYEIIQHNQEK